MKRMILGTVAALLVSAPVWACPEFPRHPNMHKAAQDLCAAHQAVNQAIEANKAELGGHAAEAQKLLNQAMQELKQAAEFANKRGPVKK